MRQSRSRLNNTVCQVSQTSRESKRILQQSSGVLVLPEPLALLGVMTASHDLYDAKRVVTYL